MTTSPWLTVWNLADDDLVDELELANTEKVFEALGESLEQYQGGGILVQAQHVDKLSALIGYEFDLSAYEYVIEMVQTPEKGKSGAAKAK